MNHIHFNFYCYNVVFLYTYITFFCSTHLVSHAFKNDGGLSRRHTGYNSLPTASVRAAGVHRRMIYAH